MRYLPWLLPIIVASVVVFAINFPGEGWLGLAALPGAVDRGWFFAYPGSEVSVYAYGGPDMVSPVRVHVVVGGREFSTVVGAGETIFLGRAEVESGGIIPVMVWAEGVESIYNVVEVTIAFAGGRLWSVAVYASTLLLVALLVSHVFYAILRVRGLYSLLEPALALAAAAGLLIVASETSRTGYAVAQLAERCTTQTLSETVYGVSRVLERIVIAGLLAGGLAAGYRSGYVTEYFEALAASHSLRLAIIKQAVVATAMLAYTLGQVIAVQAAIGGMAILAYHGSKWIYADVALLLASIASAYYAAVLAAGLLSTATRRYEAITLSVIIAYLTLPGRIWLVHYAGCGTLLQTSVGPRGWLLIGLLLLSTVLVAVGWRRR